MWKYYKLGLEDANNDGPRPAPLPTQYIPILTLSRHSILLFKNPFHSVQFYYIYFPFFFQFENLKTRSKLELEE